MSGWIAVDLDGTLAEYDGWQGVEHIGSPVPAMVERVKTWLEDGIEVRILTARVCSKRGDGDAQAARDVVKAWCREHIGRELVVTASKDFGMVEQWDDRAVQVVPNTGETLVERIATLTARIAELEAENERLRAAVTTYVELNESKWEDVDEDHIGHNLGQRFGVAETALYDILDAARAPHPSRSEDGGA